MHSVVNICQQCKAELEFHASAYIPNEDTHEKLKAMLDNALDSPHKPAKNQPMLLQLLLVEQARHISNPKVWPHFPPGGRLICYPGHGDLQLTHVFFELYPICMLVGLVAD